MILIPTTNSTISKIATSSLTRQLTDGEIYCIGNEPRYTFKIQRAHTHDIIIEDLIYANLCDCIAKISQNFFSLPRSPTIRIFAPQLVCLRNPDHLFLQNNNNSNIQYTQDRQERLKNSNFAALFTTKELSIFGHRFVSSPGIFSIQSEYLNRLITTWKEVQQQGQHLDEAIREKAVWNKTLVMLAGEMTQKPFERGEVIPVREGEIDWDEVRNACIVSVSDWKDEKAKEHFLRCLYFGHFFGDESGLMLNILDP